MKTTDLIKGLQILQPYYSNTGYNTGAEHDVIYAYATDAPLTDDDIAKMIELGWIQEDAEYGDEFTAADYDAEESWSVYL